MRGSWAMACAFGHFGHIAWSNSCSNMVIVAGDFLPCRRTAVRGIRGPKTNDPGGRKLIDLAGFCWLGSVTQQHKFDAANVYLCTMHLGGLRVCAWAVPCPYRLCQVSFFWCYFHAFWRQPPPPPNPPPLKQVHVAVMSSIAAVNGSGTESCDVGVLYWCMHGFVSLDLAAQRQVP